MPTVQTNDIDTYYERRGSGPAVVFVHGAIVDHSQWDAQLDALADEYTTVAYDVRGHGRTGGSAIDSYDVDLFVDDLDTLLTALDLDRPVLCGHSTGGCIAQVYAARYPERVSGLILADTFSPPLFDRSEWLQRSLALRATTVPVRFVGYERVERVLVWLQERVNGEGVSGDYSNIERLRESGPRMTTDEFVKVVRAVARFHETDLDLSAITVPTLVLYGEHEPPFVLRHAQHFASEIPDVTVREVPGAGHASNLDAPAFFTDSVRSFVETLASEVTASGSTAHGVEE